MVIKRSRASTRIMLGLIALVCALPIILSCFFYFVVKPSGGMSYGRLLEVKSIANTPLWSINGQSMHLAHFHGKWLLLMIAGGACDSTCQDMLFAIRQYRAGQGIDVDKIKRVWIIHDNAPVNSHLASFLTAGVEIVRAQPRALNLQPVWHRSIFLIDPHGNQVMQYQLGQDHRKIMNEIGKIIKNNSGLG